MERQLDPKPIIRPGKFAHIVLRTSRIPELCEWYGQVLGAETIFCSAFAAFLTYDEEHHRIALLSPPDLAEAPKNSRGLDHFAYTFDSLGDLLQTYKRLQEAEIQPVWTINHGPTTSMYYEDPDGNRVELQVDNFETAEEANAWMLSETFEKNPIGVEFDAERLLERYERGDPIEELIRQGSA